MARLHNKFNNKELKNKLFLSDEERTTISFYQYYHIKNPDFFRNHLWILLEEVGTLGRIYIAKEGINAQVSIPKENFGLFKDALFSITFLENIRLNIAAEQGKSFFKLAIRVREKIVADGLNDDTFDVTDRGVHCSAEKFNSLVGDPNTILVDMRNHYESEVGHFKGAIIPDVDTFREQLPLVEEMLKGNEDKNLVMYCTGGIRCEKASAYYKHKGFKNVFQLDGGIIEYNRQVKEKNLENKFLGVNFVFDERLGERISEDVIAHCHQCGEACDTHKNCSNDACHILFIQCPSCSEKFDACCSKKCQDFIHLPEEEQKEKWKTELFNGTISGTKRSKNGLLKVRF
jgi:UPF0176 protein